MPTEQGPGRDEEGSPLLARKKPAEGGEENAVSWLVLDTAVKLALKGADLVTEHDQLDVALLGFVERSWRWYGEAPLEKELHHTALVLEPRDVTPGADAVPRCTTKADVAGQ